MGDGQEGFGKSKGVNKSSNSKKSRFTADSGSTSDSGEVLLKVGPLKYRAPGKRQRVIIASIVIGLNLLLVIAVFVYFYSPAFQNFIYTVGRT